MRPFVDDWADRYIHGMATYSHIERLKNIGRLTDEEFRYIIVSKKKHIRTRNVRSVDNEENI